MLSVVVRIITEQSVWIVSHKHIEEHECVHERTRERENTTLGKVEYVFELFLNSIDNTYEHFLLY